MASSEREYFSTFIFLHLPVNTYYYLLWTWEISNKFSYTKYRYKHRFTLMD